MKLIFFNDLGGKFEIENIYCIESVYENEFRLSFEKKHYLKAIAELKPSAHCYNDKAMTIDIESDTDNYHAGSVWNGYIVKGHFYKNFEIYNQ
jgi:hypothetical protein